MATYIRVDRTRQLVATAQQQMAENRFLQQDQREQQAAQRQITQSIEAQRQAPTAAGSFWQGGRQKRQTIEEVNAFVKPKFTHATFVDVQGSYAGQTLALNFRMTTYKNIGRSRREIHKETAALTSTGAAEGFGFSYAALSCSSRGAYYPSTVTPGQYLVNGMPTPTPLQEPDLYYIAIQHNWLNVNVFDETRVGTFVGIVTSESALLGLSVQPGDFCFLLVDGPNYGYYIYDPYFQQTNPVDQSKKFGDWYYYYYTGVAPNPVLIGPKNPFPSNLLASPFYGQVRWRLYVIVLYEVRNNKAKKLKYVSPIPCVIACLAAESRSQQINIVYPFDYVAGYKKAGIRNDTSYSFAIFGRSNNGASWGLKWLENRARYAFGDPLIDEEPQPSNIFFSDDDSIIIQNYEVITWGNTKFDPATEPQPEYQPRPDSGSYNSILQDPRRQVVP